MTRRTQLDRPMAHGKLDHAWLGVEALPGELAEDYRCGRHGHMAWFREQQRLKEGRQARVIAAVLRWITRRRTWI